MTDAELLEEVRRLREDVQALRDRQAIQDVLVRYSRGLDRHDSELLASVYHEDAIDHHGDFLGPPADFVPWVNDLHAAGYVAHQHFVTNATVAVDGDVAHSEIYVQVVLRRKDGPLEICGGRYVDRLERRDGRWRIAARETLVDWACTVEGDVWPGIAPFPMGAWNRGDPSYQRPLEVPVEGARLVGD
jgi:ketosteroid isomerase-like protein